MCLVVCLLDIGSMLLSLKTRVVLDLYLREIWVVLLGRLHGLLPMLPSYIRELLCIGLCLDHHGSFSVGVT